MLKSFLSIIVLITFNSFYGQAQNIFVSPDGDDSYSGTIDKPLKTITAAVSKIQAGDTIFVKGGVYTITSTVSISTSKNGTEALKFYLFAHPGERPVFDFSSMPTNSSNRGMNLKAKYWHVKGIDFKGAGDNGMNLSGSNNVIEFCSFYENRDTGLQLSGGASNNKIINCDSYFNADPSNGNADGFAPKLDVGSNNYFYGCRAWQNSDDGWDGYLRESLTSSTILENCWCFNNGYLKNGNSSSGNGNGYKMGGGENSNSAKTAHFFKLKNCISFDNRVKGFDQNNNKGSMVIENCTAIRNGTNYSFPVLLNTNETLTLSNCIAFGSAGSIPAFAIQNTNSWLSPFVVTNDDFISIDTTGVRGPRNPDGSLPDIDFLHLTEGSDLIDVGTDVGLAYTGIAPDLGAFEYGINSSAKDYFSSLPNSFKLYQNYPNPFNPETTIMYKIQNYDYTSLKIFDVLGNEVGNLFNGYTQPGLYSVKLAAGKFKLTSGIYFYQLKNGTQTQTKKLVLLK